MIGGSEADTNKIVSIYREILLSYPLESGCEKLFFQDEIFFRKLKCHFIVEFLAAYNVFQNIDVTLPSVAYSHLRMNQAFSNVSKGLRSLHAVTQTNHENNLKTTYD